MLPLRFSTLRRVVRSRNRVQSLFALPITATQSRRIASNSSKQAAWARSDPETGDKATKWTGHGVFGVALAAGLLGWGIATTSTGRNGKGMMLLDSKEQFPRYASLKEMKIVSVSLTLALITEMVTILYMSD